MTRAYEGVDTVWVPTVPIPANGEKISERICAPAWKANADRTAYLKRVMPTASTEIMLATGGGYPGGTAFWTYGNSAALESTVAAGGYLDIADCTVGDVIQVTAFAMLARSGNMSKAINFYVDAIDRVNGTPGTQDHVDGAVWQSSTGLAAGQDAIPIPVTLSGTWTVALAGTTRLFLAFNGPTLSGGDTAKVWDGNVSAIRFPTRIL